MQIFKLKYFVSVLIVAFLFYGCEENILLNTKLLDAVKNDDVKGARTYLGMQAGVNAKDENGGNNRPLHYAVMNRSFRMTEFLLDNGASLTAKNNDMKTALDIAKELKETKIVQLMMDKLKEQIHSELKATDFFNKRMLIKKIEHYIIDGKETFLVFIGDKTPGSQFKLALFTDSDSSIDPELVLANHFTMDGNIVYTAFENIAPTPGSELAVRYQSKSWGSVKYAYRIKIIANPFESGKERAVFDELVSHSYSLSYDSGFENNSDFQFFGKDDNYIITGRGSQIIWDKKHEARIDVKIEKKYEYSESEGKYKLMQ